MRQARDRGFKIVAGTDPLPFAGEERGIGRYGVAWSGDLGEYSLDLVDQLITIVSASTIAAYSLYTFSAPNLPENHQMMITVPFAVYGLFRYLYLVHQHGAGASPEEVLLHDRPLQVCILLWAVIAVVVVGGVAHGS